MGVVPGTCDRARRWISADLDEGVSELERAQLRAHLDVCEPCAARLRELALTTAQLRYAALARPDLPPFAAPRRRRVSLRVVQTAAAAAAVLAVGGLGAMLPAPTETTAPAREPVAAKVVGATDLKLRELGRTYLKAPLRRDRRAQ